MSPLERWGWIAAVALAGVCIALLTLADSGVEASEEILRSLTRQHASERVEREREFANLMDQLRRLSDTVMTERRGEAVPIVSPLSMEVAEWVTRIEARLEDLVDRVEVAAIDAREPPSTQGTRQEEVDAWFQLARADSEAFRSRVFGWTPTQLHHHLGAPTRVYTLEPPKSVSWSYDPSPDLSLSQSIAFEFVDGVVTFAWLGNKR